MSAVKKSFLVEGLKRNQIADLLNEGKRLGGKGLLDYRPISIRTGVIGKAEGSAEVSIGNTQVVAGVKVEVGEPFPDTPDEGLLIVNTEVLPVASPYAEPGPPDEDAIELSRVVDRGIRASEMIGLPSLVLEKGKKVLAVFADVSILNADGNLFDASSLAVVAAILTTKIPKYEFVNGEVKKSEELTALTTKSIPITVTMARIGNTLIVDPTAEEEAIMDARITLTSDSAVRIVAGQKGHAGSLTYEQVMKAVEIALEKGEELRRIVKEKVGLA